MNNTLSGGDLQVALRATPDRVDVTSIVRQGLRDPGVPFQASVGIDHAALVAAASHHRVLVLLGSMLRAARTLDGWPPEFVAAFLAAERVAVTLEGLRHIELTRVLEALVAARTRVLIFKGAALAHTHYPAPHTRERTDTDLFLAAVDQSAADEAFARLGYVRQEETSGRLVSYQSHYGRTDRHGLFHAFDVHWKISNRQALADRLTFEEQWAHRVPIPAIGPVAVTTNSVHSLLLALIHRAGHHPGSRTLLWTYDLHVLANGLTSQESRRFQQLAVARGLGGIAAEGLALARDGFGTAAVAPVVDALLARAPREREDDAVVVQGPWTQAGVLRGDLDALPTWRARGRLLREHLLPPVSYMRARYGVRSTLLLPGLYVWRILLGAPAWLRRHQADG